MSLAVPSYNLQLGKLVTFLDLHLPYNYMAHGRPIVVVHHMQKPTSQLKFVQTNTTKRPQQTSQLAN